MATQVLLPTEAPAFARERAGAERFTERTLGVRSSVIREMLKLTMRRLGDLVKRLGQRL